MVQDCFEDFEVEEEVEVAKKRLQMEARQMEARRVEGDE